MWKAYTLDTCMILRSDTEVQFAAGFLNYQEKMTDLSCNLSLGKLKNMYLKLLTNDKWYKINKKL